MDENNKREEKYIRMTTAPLYPLLWKMAVPSMIGMMVASVYSMTDTYFVGKLDKTELTAAVGVVFSFVSIIQAIGFWFGYGSGNYISRQVGKKNTEEAEKMASVGFTAAAACGIIILIFGLIFISPLSIMIGAGSSDSLKLAVIRYLRITLISVPFMLVSNVLYNQLRLQGSAKDSMMGLLIGMLLNMLLDPFFILVLHMDVAGAALASLIGQITGTVLLFVRTHKEGNIRVYPIKTRPDFFYVKEMLAGGAPNFCRQGISSISGVILNVVAGGFGDSCLAGMTIAQRILSIGYALVIGFGQGFQPICLVNYSAERFNRIKRAFVYALGSVTVFLCVAGVCFGFKNTEISALFTTDTVALKVASEVLKAYSFVFPFMGFYILVGMLMQNIGRFGQATLITTMENGIFLIPFVLILPYLFDMDGLIWCKPVSSIAALLFSVPIGIRAWKKYLHE